MLNIQIKEIKTTQGRLKPQQRKQNKSKIIIIKKAAAHYNSPKSEKRPMDRGTKRNTWKDVSSLG